ncbi:hypothetical protein [Curtobacterium luteum]|uniref:hypothetical protein n=1 Tax=Curtobacterium luteum TaxID=33881 RepID=UPI003829D2FF
MSRDQWLGTCLEALVFVSGFTGWILSLAARDHAWALPVMIGCYLIAAASFIASLTYELRARRNKKPPSAPTE